MILEMSLLDDGGSEILETWKDSMFEILTYSGSFYCHYDATMCNYIASLHFAMVICVGDCFHCFRHVDCHGKSAIFHSCWTKTISNAPKACRGFQYPMKKNTRNSRNSHDESNKPAEVWKTHRNTIFAYVSPSPGWVPNTQFLAATRFSQGDINHGKSCAVSIFLNRLRPFVPYWKRQNLGFL